VEELLSGRPRVVSPDQPLPACGGQGAVAVEAPWPHRSLRRGPGARPLSDCELQPACRELWPWWGPWDPARPALARALGRMVRCRHGRTCSIDGVDVTDLALPDLRRLRGPGAPGGLICSPPPLADNLRNAHPDATWSG